MCHKIEAEEKEDLFMKIKVFLDTNILLKGFAAFKQGQILPAYLIDPNAERYTFEKCIYEAYMAFRGIGGKKPDEGRGDWAQKHLNTKTDPSPVGKLISQIHDGDKDLAFFWINQILEAKYAVNWDRERIDEFVSSQKRPVAYAHLNRLQQLACEREKFAHLCDEFGAFLDEHAIQVLSYCTVFDFDRHYSISRKLFSIHAGALDSFVRDTVLPSEDLEIVFAALSLPADVFVTDDTRLTTCAMSLGLNFPLSPNAFCTGKEYPTKIEEERQKRLELINEEPDTDSC
jgi:hypothetical protein